MALLMTLVIVALLSVLVFAMTTRSLMAVTKAKNSVNALKASYILRSGVSTAMGVLELDAKTTAIDTLSEAWAQEVTSFPVAEGTVSIRVGDEASRFNINTLMTPQGRVNERAVQRFGRLLKSVGSDEGLAERAVEWLRSHREPLLYTFRDTSELLLVAGMSSEAVKNVEDYVTVYTDRSNERNINVNTATREVLLALSPRLNEALVNDIVVYRKERPFHDVGQVKKVQGMNDAILLTFGDVIDVKSSNFSVRAEARVADVVKKGLAVVRRDGSKVRIVTWKEE